MPELGGGICDWKQMGDNWSPTQAEFEAIHAWGDTHPDDIKNHRV